MRLTLLEPHFRMTAGHQLNYTLVLGRAAQERGIDVRAVVPRDIEPDTAEILADARIEVAPRYLTDLALRPKARAMVWPLTAVDCARVLIGELGRGGPADILFSYSGDLEHMTGALGALALSTSRRPVVFQMARWERQEAECATPRLLRSYRYFTEWMLREQLDGNYLVLTGHSSPVAEFVSTRAPRPVYPLPMAADWAKLPMRLAFSDGETPRVGFLGPLRTGKGFVQFVRAIGTVKMPMHWVVQVYMPPGWAQEPAATGAVERLRERRDCTLIDRPLEVNEYYDLMDSLDIVALPYDPILYANRSSSILGESLGLGKAVVTPADTWMARMLEASGAGIIYRAYTPEGLARALQQAVEQGPELARRAAAYAPVWRDENCGRAVLDRLLELCGSR